MKKTSAGFIRGAYCSLLAVALLAPLAGAVDWTGVTDVGGFLGFNQYGTGVPFAATQTQGVSFLYGLRPGLRVGGDLGLLMVNSGTTPSTTDFGFSISPTADLDLISKPSGSLYMSGHLLSYSYQGASANGSTNAWALGIATLGLGLEAKISSDFGVSFEGDVLRFGLTGGTGASSISDFGVLLFPAVRIGAKMYFGGKGS